MYKYSIMLPFKDYLNEIKNNDNKILNCYSILRKSKYKNELGGGNCGMVAYAILMYLKDNTLSISYSTDSKTNEDFEENIETDTLNIFHVAIYDGKQYYDETGIINNNYLNQLAKDQYGKNQNIFTYKFNSAKNTHLKIIRLNTEWTVEWKEFYNVLTSTKHQIITEKEEEITQWYHGTPHKITSFSTEFVGQGTDQEGPGIYFTSNEEDAYGYSRKSEGGHVYLVQLNFRKTVPLKGRLPMKELEQMIRWAEDYETKLMNWGSESLEENMKLFKQSLMREDGPHQAFLSVYVNMYRYTPQEFCSNMVSLGYDGVIVPRGFMNTKHAIVYNPRIIRVIEEY